MSRTIIHTHSIATRWFHWVNFPLLGVMIWSGLLIYWANDIYGFHIGSTIIFHFFPENFYDFLDIPYHLADGMALHFTFMWLFMINGVLYVGYTALSGEWRYLLPRKNALREAWQVFLYEMGIGKTLPDFEKYSAAQRVAYTAIIIMGIGSVLTGISIYKPVQLQWLNLIFGGYESARLIHFILTVGYVLFFLIHITQVIRTGWQNFAGMIRGFEVKPEKNKKP